MQQPKLPGLAVQAHALRAKNVAAEAATLILQMCPD